MIRGGEISLEAARTLVPRIDLKIAAVKEKYATAAN
jgi:hypothetical protein